MGQGKRGNRHCLWSGNGCLCCHSRTTLSTSSDTRVKNVRVLVVEDDVHVLASGEKPAFCCRGTVPATQHCAIICKWHVTEWYGLSCVVVWCTVMELQFSWTILECAVQFCLVCAFIWGVWSAHVLKLCMARDRTNLNVTSHTEPRPASLAHSLRILCVLHSSVVQYGSLLAVPMQSPLGVRMLVPLLPVCSLAA